VAQATESAIALHEEAKAAYEGDAVRDQRTRIVGVVKFDGRPLRMRPVRMDADPFCVRFHNGRPQPNPSFLMTPDNELQNVFIHVKSGPGVDGKSFAPPEEAAVLDQLGCEYLPHVLGIQAGQTLSILNSDNTLHNVRMSSDNNGSFNKGMPVKGMVFNEVFSNPDMNVGFKCDVHGWMGAWLYVMEHPFFAVSDVEGRFEIRGLPPGEYTLEAIHEIKAIRPVEFKVTVEADSSIRRDVEMAGG